MYGGLGVAYATFAAEVVVLLYSVVLVCRVTQYMPALGMIFKILGATALMAAVLWLLQDQHVLLMIGAGVVSYVVGLFVTRAVTWANMQDLWRTGTKY